MGELARVAIVVPVYNVEKYLAPCLESCIAQTLYDIEIICVNDGSTDGSAEILEKYKEIDDRIQVIYQENSGLSAARNTGIKAARAEWIMFLDSDDYLMKDACEKIWVNAQHHYTEIMVYGARVFPESPQCIPWLTNVLHPEDRRHKFFVSQILFKKAGAWPFVWRQAFSRDFLERTGLLFDESVKYGEDTIFQFEAFPQAQHFLFMSDELYNYRYIREGSLMTTTITDTEKKIRFHLDITERILNYWKEKQWLEQYGREFLVWYLNFLVYDLKYEKLENKDALCSSVKEQIKKYGLKRYSHRLGFRTIRLWNFIRFKRL